MAKTKKRHHTVPQFYLRNWADERDYIAVMGEAGKRVVRVRNAGLVKNFYAVPGTGLPEDAAEDALAGIESAAAPALRRLTDQFPPSEVDRQAIALFLGMQLTRTRHFRQIWENGSQQIGELVMKMWGANSGARGYIKHHFGTDDPPPELLAKVQAAIDDPGSHDVGMPQRHLVAMAIHGGEYVANILVQMTWQIAYSFRMSFLTSDNPVALWDPDAGPHDGIGLFTSREVRFPLDRRHALVLRHPPEDRLGEVRRVVDDAEVVSINRCVVGWAHSEFYDHPSGLVARLVPVA
jgi:hypothetical protein